MREPWKKAFGDKQEFESRPKKKKKKSTLAFGKFPNHSDAGYSRMLNGDNKALRWVNVGINKTGCVR